MFANIKAFSGFAVDDLQKAKEFYGDVLGLNLSVLDERMGLMTLHLAGDRDTLVYARPNHSPADFTIRNFPVDDIAGAVSELTARGVRFERYDGFDQARTASSAVAGPRSHGSRIRPATCYRCSSRRSAAPGRPAGSAGQLIGWRLLRTRSSDE